MHLHPSFNIASVLRSATVLAALAVTVSSSAQPTQAWTREPLAEQRFVPVFDCNENGIEDAVDIAVGSSSDANNNGLPDECEGRATD
jgi:hypothetical protein